MLRPQLFLGGGVQLAVSFVHRTSQVVVIALGIAAVPAAIHSAQDPLAQLGVTAASARDTLMNSLASGSVNIWGAAAAFKKADAAVRAQLVTGALAWARTYTASPEFKTAYTQLREERKPKAPVFKGTPEEELAAMLAKQKADAQKSQEDMKKALESMTPDMRKQVEAGMKEAAAAIAQMDTPEMRKIQLDGLRMQRDAQKTQYAADSAKWEAEYPVNPAALIAKRLRSFLDLSATVNFDAKTEPRDGKLRFVDPQLERKSAEWKLCYRAGRPAVEAARAAAQSWLAELK